MLASLEKWIHDFTGIPDYYIGKSTSTFLTIALILFIRWYVLKLTHKYKVNVRTKYKINKASTYTATLLIAIFSFSIWRNSSGKDWDISTYFGLLSAGLAVAMKDLLVNMAGWLFIMWKRPFEVGDRVQIGEQKGDVVDQRLFMFTLLEIGNWVDAEQSTGRIIHIPNGRIFSETLASYSKGFEYIWNEIPVLITFESDWKEAKQILVNISKEKGTQLTKSAENKVRNASKRFMIFYNNLTPIVYTSVKENGVMLTIRYLTEPRKRRNTEQEIWEEVLTKFSVHNNIDFAYPTTRFFNNSLENKKATHVCE